MAQSRFASRARAFAKINLSLRVVGTRPDGYHELRTIFQSIGLHDTLTVRSTSGPFRLTCSDPSCPEDASNLVWRAAEAVWEASKRRGGLRDVAIHIEKRIPMQAGLGGGSSDAAAAIRLLGARWKVPDDRQRAIGAALGADVPYFFEGGTALGLNRGDQIVPLLERQPAWVVVAVPTFGISTKEAFAWFDRLPRRLRDAPSAANDLQRAVERRHPEVGRFTKVLRRQGAELAAMSGSGSAVFGLFRRRIDADRAAVALGTRARATVASRVFVTRTIDRERYQRLAAK
ncbi:MAG TPA: 4-(cytidine 5'-diphospho)-2-C-methyl-D-erythritol kinase [Vicinamibacterales bacterium]|jgi:4-diphosphocytidyl-2-C-methyl-D-erythritol kinase